MIYSDGTVTCDECNELVTDSVVICRKCSGKIEAAMLKEAQQEIERLRSRIEDLEERRDG